MRGGVNRVRPGWRFRAYRPIGRRLRLRFPGSDRNLGGEGFRSSRTVVARASRRRACLSPGLSPLARRAPRRYAAAAAYSPEAVHRQNIRAASAPLPWRRHRPAGSRRCSRSGMRKRPLLADTSSWKGPRLWPGADSRGRELLRRAAKRRILRSPARRRQQRGCMLKIELEREEDGRWIAEVPALPGVLAYGDFRDGGASPCHFFGAARHRGSN